MTSLPLAGWILMGLILLGGLWGFFREGASPGLPRLAPAGQPRVAEPATPPNPLEHALARAAVPAPQKTYHVSPTGDDARDGQSPATAFQSIQKAVDLAQPGELIHLADGRYLQGFTSKRSGTPEAPIRLVGSREAVLQGNGAPRVIEIHHDYLTLEGFTVDGLVGDPKAEAGYRDKLIYVQGTGERRGVRGLRLLRLALQNAGGECIRLRYFAVENEIAHNAIRRCGAYDFVLDQGGKNGEGIYIGTAPEQRDDGRNPTEDTDVSQDNWIHHNTIDTQGNECVDIKEGSRRNFVEHNRCTGQRDDDSAGLGARGNENIFRYNEVSGSQGAGIRVGGDKKGQGIDNFLYRNTLRDNEEGGIKIMRHPQALVCGNVYTDNAEGAIVGEYAEDYPLTDCPAS